MSNRAGDPHRRRHGVKQAESHVPTQDDPEPHWGHGTTTPRLFDLEDAATYLGLSPWTVRELEAKQVLPRVRIPLPGGGELRKLLFDRADLDRLIEAWKDAAE
jgi:hypothetical protein